jgi:hypothetical protein
MLELRRQRNISVTNSAKISVCFQGAPMSSSSAESADRAGVGLTPATHLGRAVLESELRPPGIPIGLWVPPPTKCIGLA